MMEQLIKDIEIEYGKEKAKFVSDILRVVTAKVKAKNLFGWRYFLEDLLIDVVSWIIGSRFSQSGGVYVSTAMQVAIDKCRWCNAAKRRGNFENQISLDDEESNIQIADDSEEEKRKTEDLCIDISIKFGEELAEELRPYLMGYVSSLSKEVLAKIRTPEFIEWFKEYRGI